MFRIVVYAAKNTHEYEELAKVFLRPSDFEVATSGYGDVVTNAADDKNAAKRDIYRGLEKLTGHTPKWGIITGIRPVKLFADIARELKVEGAEASFRDHYLVSKEKIDLVRKIYDLQQERFSEATSDSVGIYIGIPFCPSRCLYCSFASNKIEGANVEGYMCALHHEISACAVGMAQKKLRAESIYIGGGTPTSLDENELKKMLAVVGSDLTSDETREINLEAGRPDTIDEGKLSAARKAGVGRISINPQSMNDETLQRIGREHTSADIKQAFAIARQTGDFDINCDVIAGLPGEDENDFQRTLEELIMLEPDNITVHSLALKRTSRLTSQDDTYHYKKGDLVSKMLKSAELMMANAGYRPYYLYRQKQMAGALENVGYAKPGTEGLYNVRIMDEHQSIIAMGAGAISKAYDHHSRSHSRIANVSNYNIYIERIDEMIERKKQGLFQEENNAD